MLAETPDNSLLRMGRLCRIEFDARVYRRKAIH